MPNSTRKRSKVGMAAQGTGANALPLGNGPMRKLLPGSGGVKNKSRQPVKKPSGVTKKTGHPNATKEVPKRSKAKVLPAAGGAPKGRGKGGANSTAAINPLVRRSVHRQKQDPVISRVAAQVGVPPLIVLPIVVRPIAAGKEKSAYVHLAAPAKTHDEQLKPIALPVVEKPDTAMGEESGTVPAKTRTEQPERTSTEEEQPQRPHCENVDDSDDDDVQCLVFHFDKSVSNPTKNVLMALGPLPAGKVSALQLGVKVKAILGIEKCNNIYLVRFEDSSYEEVPANMMRLFEPEKTMEFLFKQIWDQDDKAVMQVDAEQ